MKYSTIKVSPIPNHSYKVLEAIKYKDIVVPAGYITNGADVPLWFRCVLPPNRSDYLPAIIVHDYLCNKKEFIKADNYFREILTSLNVGSTRVDLLYLAVRLYTKFIRRELNDY